MTKLSKTDQTVIDAGQKYLDALAENLRLDAECSTVISRVAVQVSQLRQKRGATTSEREIISLTEQICTIEASADTAVDRSRHLAAERAQLRGKAAHHQEAVSRVANAITQREFDAVLTEYIELVQGPLTTVLKKAHALAVAGSPLAMNFLSSVGEILDPRNPNARIFSARELFEKTQAPLPGFEAVAEVGSLLGKLTGIQTRFGLEDHNMRQAAATREKLSRPTFQSVKMGGLPQTPDPEIARDAKQFPRTEIIPAVGGGPGGVEFAHMYPESKN